MSSASKKIDHNLFENIRRQQRRDLPIWDLSMGAVRGMKVPAMVISRKNDVEMMIDEVLSGTKGGTSFTPSLVQLANAATLPGSVGTAVGLPDIHTGYGFAIGSAIATDIDMDGAICPGGIGFDINCGVRVLRTNLTEKDLTSETKKSLTQALYDRAFAGVGRRGTIPLEGERALNEVLLHGMNWAVRKGYAWKEDVDFCEDNGCMREAVLSSVSSRARKRGAPQLGTLGSGNHYLEVQCVEEIHDPVAARCFGLRKGQVVIMLHTGSRGLGHQIATDALVKMEEEIARKRIEVNDRQLAYARISSPEGKAYFGGMCAAANFAFVNRSCVTFYVRQAFEKTFKLTPDELEMEILYDVTHNMAKKEEHWVDNKLRNVLVHRKGSTRSFGPDHPSLPTNYQRVGQPVLIGGSMGTNSWILTGTTKAGDLTFSTTCHGAGRARSRTQARKLSWENVMRDLQDKNISIRVTNKKAIVEEAPEAYKDVDYVVQTCVDVGISKKVAKLRPVAVVKG